MIDWLEIISWIGLVVAVASALLIMIDIYPGGHRPPMRIMEAVWPITALYMGVIGVVAYWSMSRPKTQNTTGAASHQSLPKKPLWQQVFVSVCHCGGGCTLGDIIAEWSVFLTGFTLAGAAIWSELLVDFILALLLGIIFQYFAIVPMRHYDPIIGLREAAKADFLSLVAFEVGLFGWMLFMYFVVFQPSLHPDSPVYWFMMQLGMAIGFLTSYPMNWWLISKGIKESM